MCQKARVLVQLAIDIDSNNALHDSTLYPYLHPQISLEDTLIDIDGDIDLVVYPNPFNDVLNLEITNNHTTSKNIEVLVVDFDNHIVLSDSFTVTSNSTTTPYFNTTTFDTSEFYVVKIMIGIECVQYKLIYKE